MTTPTWTTHSIDTQVALRTAASRLSADFRGIYGTETIERFLHNAGRSQMALGFFQALVGDQAVAWSGGSEPGHEVNRSAIEAMAERGIDISGEFPKPWTDETVRAADVVISMGCGDACPIFPGKRYESWDDLADPAGLAPADVRPIRDDIERRVRDLIDQLGIPGTRQR